MKIFSSPHYLPFTTVGYDLILGMYRWRLGEAQAGPLDQPSLVILHVRVPD